MDKRTQYYPQQPQQAQQTHKASTSAECKTCPMKNTRNSDGTWKFSIIGV